MPRNKSTKRTNKRQSVSNILVSVQKMEMELLQAPAKLAAQLDKEINNHKKQEKKLINAQNKVNKQMMTAEKRFNKAKTSGAGKKQLKAAKKIYSAVTEAHAGVTKQLQVIKNTLAALLDKQSKFTAIGKSLNQFNKEWAKAAKQAKAKPQATKVKSKKSKAKHDKANVEHLHSQSTDTAVDNPILDEITELAS